MFLSLQLLFWQTITLAATAVDGQATAPTHSSRTPVELDLSSTSATLTANHLTQAAPITIQVGSVNKTLTAATLVTPAELLAAYQVFSTGNQSIILSAAGNAVGGSLALGAKFSQYVSALVIPQGVTAVRDFGRAQALNLTGNLVNQGNFYAYSSNPLVNTAAVSANNIVNQTGALLSSVLPAQGLPGLNSAVSALNLQLTAAQNLYNAGTI